MLIAASSTITQLTLMNVSSPMVVCTPKSAYSGGSMCVPRSTSEDLTEQPEPFFGIARIARTEHGDPPVCLDGHARALGSWQL